MVSKRPGEEETKTYVELFYPGILFAEEEQYTVKVRSPRTIAKKYPKAFAFKFYDLTSKQVMVDGVRRTIAGDKKKVSPTYYPGGVVLTAAGVKRLSGDHETLFSNMRSNGWLRVVKCRTGNFQPFNNGGVVLR